MNFSPDHQRLAIHDVARHRAHFVTRTAHSRHRVRRIAWCLGDCRRSRRLLASTLVERHHHDVLLVLVRSLLVRSLLVPVASASQHHLPSSESPRRPCRPRPSNTRLPASPPLHRRRDHPLPPLSSAHPSGGALPPHPRRATRASPAASPAPPPASRSPPRSASHPSPADCAAHRSDFVGVHHPRGRDVHLSVGEDRLGEEHSDAPADRLSLALVDGHREGGADGELAPRPPGRVIGNVLLASYEVEREEREVLIPRIPLEPKHGDSAHASFVAPGLVRLGDSERPPQHAPPLEHVPFRASYVPAHVWPWPSSSPSFARHADRAPVHRGPLERTGRRAIRAHDAFQETRHSGSPCRLRVAHGGAPPSNSSSRGRFGGTGLRSELRIRSGSTWTRSRGGVLPRAGRNAPRRVSFSSLIGQKV
eukprot:31473-Pelagococcus_subviridis.AAC.2